MEQELTRGRDLANQLLEVLVDESNIHLGDKERSLLPFAEDLVRKIQRTFTNSLLLLNANQNCDEVVVPLIIKDFSLSTSSCANPEDIDETCKSFIIKNRRGCYKRKSIAPTWNKDSSIHCEDGHAWRKYGQKKTTKSKYLRSYYRCSYKNEQGCQAIKQVQRIQEDPPLYRTTYNGHHTCESCLNPELQLEPASSFESSTLLCFNNNIPSKEVQPLSSSVPSSTKQEPVEAVPDDHIAQKQLSSSNDINLLCDYGLDYNYSRHATMLSSTNLLDSTMFMGALDFDG